MNGNFRLHDRNGIRQNTNDFYAMDKQLTEYRLTVQMLQHILTAATATVSQVSQN